MSGEVMSYTPPRSGSEKAKRRGHPKWQNENQDPRHNYPLQMQPTSQPQRRHKKRHSSAAEITTQSKNNIRHLYNDGGQNKQLPKARKPYNVEHA